MPQENNFRCRIPDNVQSQIDDSGASRPEKPVFPSSDGFKPEVDLDYDTKGMSSNELEITPSRARREIKKDPETAGASSLKEVNGKLSNLAKDSALLSCDDETSEFNVKCIEIRCTAENVQPRSISVVIFYMVLINNTASEFSYPLANIYLCLYFVL